MTRAEKIAEARQLRAKGMAYMRIAERLGVGTSTVQRWLKPEFAERQRQVALAWKRRNRERTRAYDREYARDLSKRGRCRLCDGPMGVHMRTDGVCRTCRHAEVEVRWEQIEAWWAEGVLMPDIARRLGWTLDHLKAEMGRMRKAGRLPYRYKAWAEKAA